MALNEVSHAQSLPLYACKQPARHRTSGTYLSHGGGCRFVPTIIQARRCVYLLEQPLTRPLDSFQDDFPDVGAARESSLHKRALLSDAVLDKIPRLMGGWPIDYGVRLIREMQATNQLCCHRGRL